jgi:predicted RNA-binding Zn ribbon-like protein
MVTVLHTQLDLVRDYVNTLDFETGIDTIAAPDELATWFSEQGLVDDFVEPSDEEVADALAVREAIRELLLANNGVDADAAGASKTLEEAGRKAHLGVRFEDGRPVLLAPEATERAARSDASSRPSPSSRRPTSGSGEGLPRRALPRRLHDKSRNRSRAWCSMEVCGIRDKARSFRKRHAAA